MWGRIRARLSYANVMSTLAVFMLLAGGGAIAASKLKRNAVKSKNIAPNAVKGVDADEATFEKVPLAGSADTANAVAPNSVGSAGIQNPARSINLPLGSFVNSSTGTLDFSSDADGIADFAFPSGGELAIVFDDTGGSVDTLSILTNFMVPVDYASGGSFAFRASKGADTGSEERINTGLSVNGAVPGAGTLTEIPTTGNQVYTTTPSPSTPYAAGNSVEVGFNVSSTAGMHDDPVNLYAVEFRYMATQ